MNRQLPPSAYQLLLVCAVCTLPLTAAEQHDPSAAPGAAPEFTIASEVDAAEVSEIVVIVGSQSANARMFAESPGAADDEDPGAELQSQLDELLCRFIREEDEYGTASRPASGLFERTHDRALGHLRDFCDPPSGGFDIIYSECSMRMKNDDGIVRFLVPSDGGPAQMQLVSQVDVRQPREEGSDCEDLTYERWLALPPDEQYLCTDPRFDLSDTPCDNPQGCTHRLPLLSVLDLEWYTNSELVPKAKKTRDRVSGVGNGGLVLGAETTRVKFKLKAKNDMFELVGLAGGSRAMPGPMGKVTYITEGHALVAPDAPGRHVIQAFYDNLSSRIARGQSVSLFGGLIKSHAALLQYGVPLRIDQKSAVRIMGLPNIMPNLGQKASQKVNITGIAWYLSRHDWCLPNEFPTDYGLFDLSDLMTGEGEPGTDSGEGFMSESARLWREGMRDTFGRGRGNDENEQEDPPN